MTKNLLSILVILLGLIHGQNIIAQSDFYLPGVGVEMDISKDTITTHLRLFTWSKSKSKNHIIEVDPNGSVKYIELVLNEDAIIEKISYSLMDVTDFYGTKSFNSFFREVYIDEFGCVFGLDFEGWIKDNRYLTERFFYGNYEVSFQYYPSDHAELIIVNKD